MGHKRITRIPVRTTTRLRSWVVVQSGPATSGPVTGASMVRSKPGLAFYPFFHFYRFLTEVIATKCPPDTRARVTLATINRLSVRLMAFHPFFHFYRFLTDNHTARKPGSATRGHGVGVVSAT